MSELDVTDEQTREESLTIEDEDDVNLTTEQAEKLLESTLKGAQELSTPDDDVQKQINEMVNAPARAAQKPNIDYLEDAVVETDEHGVVFLPQVNDGLVIQYPQNWRDTTYYVIRKIDYETGSVSLWNPKMGQWGLTNFINAKKHGLILKMPPEGASGLRMALALGQRKRGRPRKNPLQQALAQPVEKSGRGRGRPKGTKNRPKEVIEAEKRQRREERNERARARSMRSRIRTPR